MLPSTQMNQSAAAALPVFQDAVPAAAHLSKLPQVIDHATAALTSARSAGELLEARDLASFAYDAAKRAARLAKAKNAHDELIAAAHRAQADALTIEALAKRRLADEYDAAQERGEIARHGGGRKFKVGDPNVEITAADLGLRRDEIHEARVIRDAEQAEPGIVRRTLDEKLARGEEHHVTRNTRHSPRALRALAAALPTVRGVQEPDAWLRLAVAAAGKQTAPVCVVLLHGLPDLLLGTRPEVSRHG